MFAPPFFELNRRMFKRMTDKKQGENPFEMLTKNHNRGLLHPDLKLKDIFDEIVQGFLKPGVIG
jgi:hypothetical protein